MIIRLLLTGAAALSLAACSSMGMGRDSDAAAAAGLADAQSGPVSAIAPAPATDREAAAPGAQNCRPEDAGPMAQTPGQNCGKTGPAGPQ